jgi:magnesium-transporting ATPase (P-type)
MDYLYYKLYKASKRSSLSEISEFLACVFLGGLFSVNILVLNAWLAKLDVIPFIFPNAKLGGMFALFLILVVCIIYLRRNRYKIILRKYSNESDREKLLGNIFMWIYVLFSFLAIFIIAFYKPGKL